MDLNIVTLEIADHIFHFNYYHQLVSDSKNADKGVADEQLKIFNKYNEHVEEPFPALLASIANNEVQTFRDLTNVILKKLNDLKSKEIHELIEKLEKDAKKIKKLYKATN